MDTLRVDVSYRSLRVAWAIHSTDFSAFREAIRLSYCLWGGRFNPIVFADKEEEARRLIDLYRVDLIFPIGDSKEVLELEKKFPHLHKPFFSEGLFTKNGDEAQCNFLDIQNALVHYRTTPHWNHHAETNLRYHTWSKDDPLSDIFLVQFGEYPSTELTTIDYTQFFCDAGSATEQKIESSSPIPSILLDQLSVAAFSRFSFERDYDVRASGWDRPGFYVGDSTKLTDLVCHWNLRAADIPLWFIDQNHLPRYSEVIPKWDVLMRANLRPNAREHERHIGVWTGGDHLDNVNDIFPGIHPVQFNIVDLSWNGRNVRPPSMTIGKASVLGVVGKQQGQPSVSFQLAEKPLSSNLWFHTQQLLASISFVGGLHGDERHTFRVPYIPELNEFYGRTMHFRHDGFRVGSERIGLIIRATDTDASIRALPVAKLMEKVLSMAGYDSKLSSGGLITKQLISRLGGLQGARAFKIPGVRRLLKTHGPSASFTKNGAIQLIGNTDPDNPTAKFSDHANLYIEPRDTQTDLLPSDVFAHLVEKGLFRIGAEIKCPNCNLDSWIALDALRQSVICELCGEEHNATRQLVNSSWHYRRSGILGIEKNAQGAIPVVLTLQQLGANLTGPSNQVLYSPSLELKKPTSNLNECEIDFIWMMDRPFPRKTVVILGECKDRTIDFSELQREVENLRRVAQALPKKRFKTFILITKLNSFSPEEIELAKSINTEFEQKVILLTDRELDPYHIYEKTKKELGVDAYTGGPEELASATAKIYFPTDEGGTPLPGQA